MAKPTPFSIHIPDQTLERIAAKLAAYEWGDYPQGDGLADSWAYGANMAYMKALVAYWRDGFSWRATEARLNRLPQFRADIGDGFHIHFAHVKSARPDATPLILIHGWPGSFFEFAHIAEDLANPSDPAQPAFHVVMPSLPGYGFSDRPRRPIGQRTAAKMLRTLMTEVLGYPRYVAQGGDWGSLVASWMAFDGKANVRGLHLNMMGLRPIARPETGDELAWAEKFEQEMRFEGAYFMLQMTKPQSLAFAMAESPVGQAAWIVEKFHSWSDLKDGKLESRYTMDQLLANVMIYVVTGTFATSTWFYRGLIEEGGPNLPPGERVTVPTAAAVFRDRVYGWPPRSWVEKAYDIVRWTEMPSGGHFAALEEPKLFVGDVRAFARGLV